MKTLIQLDIEPRENWQDIEIGDEECFSARFEDNGYRTAEKALVKIKE